MTIQHSLLPDSELHGIKGAVSAASGTVPIANGAGSHSWGFPSGSIPNKVIVASLSDLPAPVSNAITLAANTVYQFSGAVDLLGNRLVLSSNSILQGSNNSVDSITSSTAGALITANTVSLRIRNLTLSCPSGKLFDFTGTATAVFLMDNVVSSSYTKIGTMNNVYSGAMSFCSFIGGDGFTFTGTGTGDIGILNSRFLSFTGTAIDLGSAVVNTISLNTVFFLGLTGSKDLSGLASSGNITIRAKVLHCTFSSAGTPLTNITTNDIKWKFDDNYGITNTLYGAQGHIIGSSLNTTFSATSTPTKVNFGTAFNSDITKRFTIDNTGKFTYTGLEDIEVLVDATIFASVSGGASRQYDFTLAKNGTSIVSTSSRRQYDGSNPGASSCTGLLELSTNDYIELYATAITATTSLNIDTSSIKIVGVS